MSQQILEREVSLLAPGCEIEGTCTVQGTVRIHGKIKGDLVGMAGSTVMICETAVIEGNVHVDEVWIDGFIRGNVRAQTKVVIASSGRVIGNVVAPSVQVQFGAHFDGTCAMEKPDLIAGLSPEPA